MVTRQTQSNHYLYDVHSTAIMSHYTLDPLKPSCFLEIIEVQLRKSKNVCTYICTTYSTGLMVSYKTDNRLQQVVIAIWIKFKPIEVQSCSSYACFTAGQHYEEVHDTSYIHNQVGDGVSWNCLSVLGWPLPQAAIQVNVVSGSQ